MNQQKTIWLFIIVVALLFGCGTQRKTMEPLTTKNSEAEISTNQNNLSMTLKIKAIANGFIKSGNYGGSTQYEVFPSVYHYTYFSSDNSQKREDFKHLLTNYLNGITVNNSVTLQEYLSYLYLNNTEKLQEIHSKNLEKKAVGNSHQELPKLFFVEDAADTVLHIDPYLAQLSWNEHTANLNLFLQENAQHFSSEIPDDFYTKYYGK